MKTQQEKIQPGVAVIFVSGEFFGVFGSLGEQLLWRDKQGRFHFYNRLYVKDYRGEIGNEAVVGSINGVVVPLDSPLGQIVHVMTQLKCPFLSFASASVIRSSYRMMKMGFTDKLAPSSSFRLITSKS